MKRWLGWFAGWALAAALAWGTAPGDQRLALTYGFKDYGVDQGLTNLAVVSLTMDPEGYLWAGTEDGVFRYDGKRFTRFHALDGLPSPSIQKVTAAADGFLWVLTEGGLARGREGHFEPVTLGQGADRDTFRQTMVADRLGGVWIGGTSGLWYGRGAAPMQKVGGVPPGPIEAVWIDPEGKRLVVARRGELHQRDLDGRWHSRKLEQSLSLDIPQAIHVDGRGRIWVRSTAWLLRFSDLAAEPEHLSDSLPANPSQGADLVPDWMGRVWVPTSRGVVCFEGDESWVLGSEQGLELPSANAVLVDHEGSIWIGSEGLHRLLGGLAWGAIKRRQGLPHDTIWSLFRTRAGAFFLGTHQGLVELQDGRWSLIPDTARRTIYAMTEDASGGFWACGSKPPRIETNVLLHRPAGGGFQSVPLLSIKSVVGCMVAASDGSFWIGTQGDGLHHGIRSAKGIESTRMPLPRQTPREQIHALQLDNVGHPVLSGTQGFAWWDGVAWRRMGKAEGLLDDHTGALTLAADGTLWLTYWEVHGLTHLRRKGPGWEIIEHLTEPAELISDAIYSMGVDAKGNLWMGTAVGVRRWDGHRLRHFTHHDGLPGDDTSGNAFLADPNGDVWFGLTAGAAHFDARHAPPNPPAPQARLGLFQDGSDRRLALGSTPVLKYQDRTVSFELSAATFLQEDRIRPQVRLVGFEDNWRDSEGFRVRYTGLPPGSYRFEARVKTPDGQFGSPIAQSFQVLPPWWRTWWAYALAIAALAGLLLSAIRWRTRFILRRMVELDALVQERTWNLEDANDALSKANLALEEASMVDPLTGLKNRRYLGLSLPEEIARVMRGYHQGGAQMKDHDLAFLLVDLDHFKAVNDTYGHGAGDAVLRQAASILRGVCRETDTVVRWGGEEFLIVAKAANRGQIEIIARNICEALRAHAFEVSQGVHIHKTCSVGFTAFPVVPADPGVFRWEEAVEVADQCLYAAKHSGRNQYVGAWASDSLIASQVQSRLLSQLPALAAEGLMNLATSLPTGRSLIWK